MNKVKFYAKLGQSFMQTFEMLETEHMGMMLQTKLRHIIVEELFNNNQTLTVMILVQADLNPKLMRLWKLWKHFILFSNRRTFFCYTDLIKKNLFKKSCTDSK